MPVLVALLVGLQSGAMFTMLEQRGDHTCPAAVTPDTVTPLAPPAGITFGPWWPPATQLQFAEPPPDCAPSVTIDVDIVSPGAYFTATVTAPANLPRNAWVGIVPSHIPHGDESVNDVHDVAYQYMEGRTRAVLTFQAPTTPGHYDLRLHDTDASGLELASSASFTVPGF